MPNQTPSVVERNLVDIPLSGGIDESQPEESVHWDKKLVNATNVMVSGNGLVGRPGARKILTSTNDADGNLAYIWKIGGTKKGLLGIGYPVGGSITQNLPSLFHLNEYSEVLYRKGRLHGYSKVSSFPISGVSGGTGVISGCFGAVASSKHYAVLHPLPLDTTSDTGYYLRLVIRDRQSENIIKTYKIGVGTGTWGWFGSMVMVDNRYIHLYVSASTIKPKMCVIDTNSLPTDSSSFSFTDVTGTSTGDFIAGVSATVHSAAGSNGSVVVTRGATCRIEKFNNSGTSVSNTTVSNITCTGTDIDTAGTMYLVGTNSGSWVYKETNTSFSVTRTVTGPATPGSGVEGNHAAHPTNGEIRVATEGSSKARLIAYCFDVDQNSVSWPCPYVFSIPSSGATSFTGLGFLPNWTEASLPYYDSTSAMYLVHMHNVVRQDSDSFGNDMSYISNCDAIINLDSRSVYSSSYPRLFNVECLVGDYDVANGSVNAIADSFQSSPYQATGAALVNRHQPYRPWVRTSFQNAGTSDVTTSETLVCTWSRKAAEPYSALVYSLHALKPTFSDQSISEKQRCDDIFIQCGGLNSYDGSGTSEFGFYTVPNFCVKATVSGGSVAAGQYSYIVVWAFTDASGRIHYSRTSLPRTITVASTGYVTVQMNVPTVTNRYDKCEALIYRTTSGGTQYSLVTRLNISTAAGTTTSPDNEVYISYSDTNADSYLASLPLLYRQPGTAGTALDRYHPLHNQCAIRHKDRVFYSLNNTVYYSSFNVDGEGTWFNPAFSFEVPGGSGVITGLGSMDGTLVIFKRDSIYLVDGDGPPENGGNGTEYSPPRRIHSEHGCIHTGSIVPTPDGLMYRSIRGIELLTRNFSVEFVGLAVSKSTQLWDGTKGGGYDRVNSRAYFNVYETAGGGTYGTIVYDTRFNTWTKQTYTDGTNPSSIWDCSFLESTDTFGRKTGKFYLLAQDSLNGLNQILYEDNTTKCDNYSGSEIFVPWTIETGWCRGPSKIDRVRVSDVTVLGRQLTNHNLKCQFYSNYDRSTATTIKTFTAADTAIVPEEMEFQPSKEAVQSMKFKITTETPTVNTTKGVGTQLELHGITVRIGLRGGGAKLPSAEKG